MSDKNDEPWTTELWTGASSPAFQIVTPDRNTPLYGCLVLARDPDATELINTMLTMKFRQQSIRTISNIRSPMKGQVKLEVVKVTAEPGPDGKLKIVAEDLLPTSTVQQLPIGQRIKLKITNDSDTDVKVVVLDIGTSGGISIMTPRGAGITIPAKGKPFTTHQVFRTRGASGVESFKLVAYATAGHCQVGLY